MRGVLLADAVANALTKGAKGFALVLSGGHRTNHVQSP
jgi:hypothetical protein